jgi:NADH:ubiquinone oxidoreductase subunit
VLYAKWDSDGSQVPPDWHCWLHHTVDDIPSASTFPKPSFVSEYRENLTGTSGAFKTYSTTTRKLEAWAPAVKERV